MSKIFDALTIVREERLKSLPPVDREPGRGSSDVLQRSVVPTDVDLFGGLEPTTRLPGKVALSHKKIRNYLMLALFAAGLVLLGTNYAFHPHGNVFANSQSVYGVAFEGTVRPASEIRITAESTGTVSNISVKVGDRVQTDQQLLRMDDRDAQLAVKQASVELQQARKVEHVFERRAVARHAIQAEVSPARGIARHEQPAIGQRHG